MDDVQEKKKTQPPYEIRGTPIHAYVTQTGEFLWTPASAACDDRQSAEKILEVFKRMPIDRRKVWASRLDLEQAKKTCPIIHQQTDLSAKFDEFVSTYNEPQGEKDSKGGEPKK